MMKTWDDAVKVTGISPDLRNEDVALLADAPVEVAVELGTLRGGTAAMLSTVAKEVYTIDMFERIGETGDKYSTDYFKQWGGVSFAAVSAALKKFPNVTVIQGLSREVPEILAGKMIDLLFIDADHFFEGVAIDYFTWLPKMKLGGRIIFHDYQDDWTNGVSVFVRSCVMKDARVYYLKQAGLSIAFAKGTP